MTESGHSLHLLTGCQAFAALSDKISPTSTFDPVVFRCVRCWVAAIQTNKISVRGEGPTMDAACQDAVNKYIYEQAIR